MERVKKGLVWKNLVQVCKIRVGMEVKDWNKFFFYYPFHSKSYGSSNEARAGFESSR